MKTYLFQPLSAHQSTQQAVAKALKEALELTSWIDRTAHISGILFNEGHIDDYNFCNKDSVLLAAMALARTQSVEVGACVVQLALNDPKLVFERFQQMQLMFPGRFVMGVGNGFHQAEGLEFGLDQNARRQIADFNRDVLFSLMNGRSVQYPSLNGKALRKIHPDTRYGSPDTSAYFDSVGSLMGAKNAIERRNNFILNLAESEEHCFIDTAQQIFDYAQATAPGIKRYLFLPTFVYEDTTAEAAEQTFLHYYNLYRKFIYRGQLVDVDFLRQRAQKNDFFLVGPEALVRHKYERIIEAIEPDGVVVQVNYGGMPLHMVTSQIALHARITHNVQRARAQVSEGASARVRLTPSVLDVACGSVNIG